MDFGEVWEDSRFSWVLPIENGGSQDVEVTEFASSCNCSAVEPRSLLIPAGESRDVRVTLDLTAQKSKAPEAEWRNFAVWLSPRLRGDPEKSQEGWNLRGRVRTAIAFEQYAVDFGRHSEASQPIAARTVVVKNFVPLQQLTATSMCPHFQVGVRRKTEERSQFELVISPQANLPIGPVRGEIIVVPHLNGRDRLQGKTLPVACMVLNDFQVTPPSALFGARPVGESVEETVTVHSLTDQCFVVTAVSTDSTDISATEASNGIAETPTFTIKQRISRIGQQSGKVTFQIRAADEKAVEVVLPVSYLGIAASTD